MPAKTSHADTFILKQGAIVFSHRGQLEGGHPFYLYIAVKGDKLAEYNALLNKPSPPSLQTLEKIGVILAFGEGEPSAEEMQRLAKEYGVQHVASRNPSQSPTD